MVKCSFCGNDVLQGTGSMFVRNDGKLFYFCSSKCKKNLLNLGRKSIRMKWTKFYKSSGKKEVAAAAEAHAPIDSPQS